MHFIGAMSSHRVGPYERYIVEWVDELSKRPIMINEGVKVIYRGRNGDTEYFEVRLL